MILEEDVLVGVKREPVAVLVLVVKYFVPLLQNNYLLCFSFLVFDSCKKKKYDSVECFYFQIC